MKTLTTIRHMIHDADDLTNYEVEQIDGVITKIIDKRSHPIDAVDVLKKSAVEKLLPVNQSESPDRYYTKKEKQLQTVLLIGAGLITATALIGIMNPFTAKSTAAEVGTFLASMILIWSTSIILLNQIEGYATRRLLVDFTKSTFGIADKTKDLKT